MILSEKKNYAVMIKAYGTITDICKEIKAGNRQKEKKLHKLENVKVTLEPLEHNANSDMKCGAISLRKIAEDMEELIEEGEVANGLKQIELSLKVFDRFLNDMEATYTYLRGMPRK